MIVEQLSNEEELRDEMIVEQSEICRAVSDIDAVSFFDELISCSPIQFYFDHLSRFCVTFVQCVFVNVSQMCRP